MRYLETTTVPVSELQRFPGNARKHAEAELIESVKEGVYKSLVVWKKDDGSMVIVAGNGTADAMSAAGITEARVELSEYTEREARRINLKDNRLSDKASDDPVLLAARLTDLDGDWQGLGFDDAEIGVLLGQEEMPLPGDAPTDDGSAGTRWGIIVECTTEDDQVALLEELGGQRGLNVRAIVG